MNELYIITVINLTAYPLTMRLSTTPCLTYHFQERARLLSQVFWYFKMDLENGYRQVPVAPIDWHTQVYSLGPAEYYIDLAMPFGKANSSKHFCAWTDL